MGELAGGQPGGRYQEERRRGTTLEMMAVLRDGVGEARSLTDEVVGARSLRDEPWPCPKPCRRGRWSPKPQRRAVALTARTDHSAGSGSTDRQVGSAVEKQLIKMASWCRNMRLFALLGTEHNLELFSH